MLKSISFPLLKNAVIQVVDVVIANQMWKIFTYLILYLKEWKLDGTLYRTDEMPSNLLWKKFTCEWEANCLHTPNDGE